ncbi:UNVERIFIED_CONTAM: hypothetical protein GTU68_037245 [Idotea baltica]|nr:hypothetical protein [Idotea baltica]
MRVLFPRGGPALDAVLINTSGGVTGGDCISVTAQVGQGSALTLTTQTAERAYRAQPTETGRVTTDISVANDGSLKWLPQEMILFNGCNLDRRLNVELAQSATALLVETIVFGRAAMGEKLDDIRFKDRISVCRNGSPLYLDGISMGGDVSAQLTRAAVAQGSGAMTSVVYVAPDAEALLNPIRAILPPFSGASLLAKDVLVIRLVAQDSFVLRQGLIPLLERLSNGPLPKTWRL